MNHEVVAAAECQGVEEIVARLNVIFQRVREAWREAAPLLAKLTTPQLQEVKRTFRGIVTADHLDRLAMMGRDELSPHLALPERSIAASVLKRLPKATLGALNDPEKEVEVWRSDGKVNIRRMRELNAMEFAAVVGPDGGLRSADAQRRFFLAMAKRPVENLKAESLLFDGLTLSEGRDELIMYLRHTNDEIGEKRYRAEVPIKTLRNFFK